MASRPEQLCDEYKRLSGTVCLGESRSVVLESATHALDLPVRLRIRVSFDASI
jgi:hypothetical protein